MVPIEVESDGAEGSGEVEESTMDQVDEGAVSHLWRNNQSRAAGRRVVRAFNLVHPHPYACENYAVITLFFINFPYLLQDPLS